MSKIEYCEIQLLLVSIREDLPNKLSIKEFPCPVYSQPEYLSFASCLAELIPLGQNRQNRKYIEENSEKEETRGDNVDMG